MKKIWFVILLFVSVEVISQVAVAARVKNVGAKTFPSSVNVFFGNDYGAANDPNRALARIKENI